MRPSRPGADRAGIGSYREVGYRVARWILGSSADAEDAVQEATLKALKSVEAVQPNTARGWFLRIVRNESLNLRRRRSTEREIFSQDESVEPCDPVEVAEEVYRRLTAERLWALMDRLPEPQKELIVMREVEELSYQEIATALNVPVGTVMSRLSRARQSLQRLIAEEGL